MGTAANDKIRDVIKNYVENKEKSEKHEQITIYYIE
jgi:hypothetical protein